MKREIGYWWVERPEGPEIIYWTGSEAQCFGADATLREREITEWISYEGKAPKPKAADWSEYPKVMADRRKQIEEAVEMADAPPRTKDGQGVVIDPEALPIGETSVRLGPAMMVHVSQPAEPENDWAERIAAWVPQEAKRVIVAIRRSDSHGGFDLASNVASALRSRAVEVEASPAWLHETSSLWSVEAADIDTADVVLAVSPTAARLLKNRFGLTDILLNQIETHAHGEVTDAVLPPGYEVVEDYEEDGTYQARLLPWGGPWTSEPTAAAGDAWEHYRARIKASLEEAEAKAEKRWKWMVEDSKRARDRLESAAQTLEDAIQRGEWSHSGSNEIDAAIATVIAAARLSKSESTENPVTVTLIPYDPKHGEAATIRDEQWRPGKGHRIKAGIE